MPGVGKSTIGKKLAEKLSWKFLDLDIFLREKTQKSPSELIQKIGEPGFLQMEAVATMGLDLQETVFAPGGSIIYAAPAMEKLKKETKIFYLSLPLAEIRKRLEENLETRGIIGLNEKGLENLYRERAALYRKYAGSEISCVDRSPEQIIDDLIQKL